MAWHMSRLVSFFPTYPLFLTLTSRMALCESMRMCCMLAFMTSGCAKVWRRGAGGQPKIGEQIGEQIGEPGHKNYCCSPRT